MPDSRDLAVVFDLDGTLLETQEFIPQSLREFGAARGLDFSGLTWLGCGLVEVVEEIRGRFGLILDVEELRAYMHPRQVELMSQAAAEGRACPPGLSELVDGLFLKHVPFGVATLSPRSRAMALLGAAGLGDTFHKDILVCHGEVELPKPAPDSFLLAAGKAGATDLAATVGIGDSPEDMLAARAAGMFAVGRVHALNDEEVLRAAGAHLLVADFRQLTVERLMELVEKRE